MKPPLSGSIPETKPLPGVVNACMRPNSPTSTPSFLSPEDLIPAVRAGLHFAELESLREMLSIPMEKLAHCLGISKPTLHRRKKSGRLDAQESDRVVRLARLVGRALEVFDNESQARDWLNSPQFGLAGTTPLDFSDTEIGAREVEDLLGRIEHGIFS